MTYHQKRQDPRWQKRRLEIMSAANFKCEECDSADDTLSVHHSHYFKDTEPWDYPASLLHCLCDGCHVERQNVEESLKIEMMKVLRFVPTKRMKAVFWRVMSEALAEAS